MALVGALQSETATLSDRETLRRKKKSRASFSPSELGLYQHYFSNGRAEGRSFVGLVPRSPQTRQLLALDSYPLMLVDEGANTREKQQNNGRSNPSTSQGSCKVVMLVLGDPTLRTHLGTPKVTGTARPTVKECVEVGYVVSSVADMVAAARAFPAVRRWPDGSS